MTQPTRTISAYEQIILTKWHNAENEAAHWQAVAIETEAENAKLKAQMEKKKPPKEKIV